MDREKLDSWCEKGILGLVLAMLVYSPLAFGAVRPQEFVVIQWLTLGILGIWAVRFLVNPKHRLLWPPVCWPVLAFVAYAVWRYLAADVEFVARQEFIRVLVYAVIFFAVINNLHGQDTTHIVGFAVVFLAMVMSLYAIFQFLTASDYACGLFDCMLKPEGYRKRGSGPFVCPNNLAGYLAMVLPLAVAFTVAGRLQAVMKVFLAYAAIAIFTGLAVTLSRGGWLAGGVSLAVLGYCLLRNRDYWKQALIALLVAAPVFLVIYFKANMQPYRFERIQQAKIVEDVRFQYWRPTVAMWQDHFWFGTGPAHFDHRFRQYRSAEPQLQVRPERAHNDYLNTLADWGLIGALLVAGCWTVFYWQVCSGWKFVQRSQNDLTSKRSNKASFVMGGAVGLLAILAHSFVDFNMHIPANAILAVTIMALVSAHYRFASERWWHTVRWPLRIPVYAVLAVALFYLGTQTWRRTFEASLLADAEETENPSVKKLRKLGLKIPTQGQFHGDVQLSVEILGELGREQVTALEKAYSIEPANFETSYKLGEIYLQRSFAAGVGVEADAERATNWFASAAAANRYLGYAWLGHGMALDWMGRTNESLAFYKKGLELDPNGARSLACMAWHYLQMRDYREARKWCERSLGIIHDPRVRPNPATLMRLIDERAKDDTATINSGAAQPAVTADPP